MSRTPLPGPPGVGGPVWPSAGGSIDVFAGVPTADFPLARSYRVDADGAPIMMIDEWFLASLGKFLLSGSGPGPGQGP